MAFVLEPIPEADKQKYSPRGLSSTWAIDHEHDAILVYTDAEAHGAAYYFDLHWGKHVIHIITKKKKTPRERVGVEKTKYDVFYDLYQIKIPKTLKDNVAAVKKLVEESLGIWGNFGIEERRGTITVQFPQESEIYFVDPVKLQVRR